MVVRPTRVLGLVDLLTRVVAVIHRGSDRCERQRCDRRLCGVYHSRSNSGTGKYHLLPSCRSHRARRTLVGPSLAVSAITDSPLRVGPGLAGARPDGVTRSGGAASSNVAVSPQEVGEKYKNDQGCSTARVAKPQVRPSQLTMATLALHDGACPALRV